MQNYNVALFWCYHYPLLRRLLVLHCLLATVERSCLVLKINYNLNIVS